MKKSVNNFLNLFLIAVIFITSGCSEKVVKQTSLKLSYNQPAVDWMTEALPIGNGYMGVMFFGGIEKEQIQFTEGTLWSGGPGTGDSYNFGIRKDAWKYLSEVRRLIKEGKMEEADQLAGRELTGVITDNGYGNQFGDFGAQQTMGDIYIEIEHEGNPENYIRELDLENSEGRISYNIGNNHYSRTYFGSYPDKAMVYRFESNIKTNYNLEFVTPHKQNSESFTNSIYSFQGEVADNGMQFETCLKIESDGDVSFDKGKIQVNNAKYLNVYHVAATDYTLQYPDYKGNDFLADNKNTLAALEDKSYELIRTSHQKDYSKLFERVTLDLGDNLRDSLPTDIRLQEYAGGTPDQGLEEIYFQFSRYLMISASRPGTMPLNLQGKWNNSTNPTWTCDYHMNINEQMLYWPAEVTNLGECHLPLFTYMESLVEPGKNSAKEFFNASGWIVNTMNNPFGYTSPGWKLPWGFFPGGAAWLCQHAWDHYDFTGNVQFLKETAYPLMKEAALFWMDYLIEDESGYLVSCPSYSPEHGGISGGTAMDHQMVWDLMSNCINASEVLGIDDEFKQKAFAVRKQLLPPQIGSWGQLQEWKEDLDDPKDKHRHVSHMFALYPGKQITVDGTPKLANAAQVSLEARGDDGTGWSLAWKISLWARLKNGDHAYELFKRLLRPTNQQKTEMMKGGGSYSNLLCAHPPFQLDGNMGGAAGMAEMLIQSQTGKIHLLPALPEAWKNGSFKGLRARGGFEIDMTWENSKISALTIYSLSGKNCQIISPNNLIMQGSKEKFIKDNQAWSISFDTEPGIAYEFKTAD
jgi:alpha-L-fucosidase 2